MKHLKKVEVDMTQLDAQDKFFEHQKKLSAMLSFVVGSGFECLNAVDRSSKEGFFWLASAQCEGICAAVDVMGESTAHGRWPDNVIENLRNMAGNLFALFDVMTTSFERFEEMNGDIQSNLVWLASGVVDDMGAAIPRAALAAA